MAVINTSINSGVTSPMGVFNAISVPTMTVPQTAAIQGKMVAITHIINDMQWAQRPFAPEEIKMRLTQLMVEEIYKNNYIEFTKQVNSISGDHIFHARLFVVPDTQVRIIRLNT